MPRSAQTQAIPNPPAKSIKNATYQRGLERLVQAVQELSLARDLLTVQKIVRLTARELCQADGATFVLRDGDLCHYADEDAIEPLWKGKRFPMSQCVSGWVMLNRQPAVIYDIYADPRIPAAAYRPTFVKSLAMVPIRTLSPIGAIGNYWARQHTPEPGALALLQALADSTAVAMENIQLCAGLEQRVRERTAQLEEANREIYDISLTDPLTGLRNRRGFHEIATPAMRSAHQLGLLICVLFIDVDGLKNVNDRHGHAVGDAMIVDTAQALLGCLRDSDIVARMGGDEFCVLSINPKVDEHALCQRIEDAFQRQRNAERPFQLSASIGAAISTDSRETLEDLITRADKAMYDKKRARRTARGA